MKRILSLIAAVFTLLISCSMPLASFAYTSVDEEDPKYYTFEEWRNGHKYTSSNYEFIFKYTDFRYFNEKYTHYYYTCGVSFSDYESNVESAVMDGSLFDVTFKRLQTFYYSEKTNNVLDNFNLNYKVRRFTFDYSTDTLSLYADDGSPIGIGYNSNTYSVEAVEYTTNFEEFALSSNINLDISFDPDLSGKVSRTNVVNGKEYTSVFLDMYVTNKGDSAQFAWFIVPKGESITFPDNLYTHNQGFFGQPVYAYVSDEWYGFSISGFQGNSVYAPSAWHHVPSGFTNQPYHVDWNHMNLKPDTEYDCVVYACLNEFSGYEKTVYPYLDDVQEIYRSTFTISDPATFNPNSEGAGSHPWDPDKDNSGLFDVSSAHKDDNGDIIIKGQQKGPAYQIGGDFLKTVSVRSLSEYFNSFISFVTAVFNKFPSDIKNVYTYGFIGVVVLGIVLKVIK